MTVIVSQLLQCMLFQTNLIAVSSLNLDLILNFSRGLWWMHSAKTRDRRSIALMSELKMVCPAKKN
ncbi:unnamed protein product [Coffea canephora]|uniref:Uncharacterized protein n=1 Tax=Coffea canephora TaxID=49390 RepID=A0A068UL77_COFCA|nr:unnamed protein product [Coffea canephora]